MKNILKIILLFSLGIFISCEKELDINTNPNTPPNITPGLALASAEASLVTVLGGDLTNLGGFYAQYYTQAPSAGQYDAIDEYNIKTNYANRMWTELYAGCLTDLNFVIERSNAANDPGTALIGTVLKSYTFQILVDLFGDVPYTEALQGENFINPSVTPGNEVYLDLISKIDAALTLYKANPVSNTLGKQDVIYNGDMDKWVRFANTLKLKLYLRMAYTSSANPAAVNALLAQNNFITSDASFAQFGTGLNQRNPFYEVQIVFLGDVNNVASSSLLEFYDGNGDTRKTKVFRQSKTGAYLSLPQGSGDGLNTKADDYSRPNIEAQTPVYLMTVSESNFLQAEGLIRYSAGTGAKAKYDTGVSKSFETYSLPAADAIALTATGGNYEYVTGLGIEAAVRQVIIQKWASLANINNIEAYIETTRTKYPEIVTEGTENYTIGNRIPSNVSILSGNTIPSILFYPDNEVTRNSNITQRASLTEKVWWDQKN